MAGDRVYCIQSLCTGPRGVTGCNWLWGGWWTRGAGASAEPRGEMRPSAQGVRGAEAWLLLPRLTVTRWGLTGVG